jgi:hypothetical protein
MRPVIQDVVRQLEHASAPGDWLPPDWSSGFSVGAYVVSSQPRGPVGTLLAAEGVDETALRAWLADWLESKAPKGSDLGPGAFFTVKVGRQGDAVPNALEPETWTSAGFSMGADPAPSDWPRVPLAQLVAFAVDDLRRGGKSARTG